jgi:hypothetical protein
MEVIRYFKQEILKFYVLNVIQILKKRKTFKNLLENKVIFIAKGIFSQVIFITW